MTNLAQTLRGVHERFRKSQQFCFSGFNRLSQRAGKSAGPADRATSMTGAARQDPAGVLAGDLSDEIEVLVVVLQLDVVEPAAPAAMLAIVLRQRKTPASQVADGGLNAFER